MAVRKEERLGDRIRAAREHYGMSATLLAERVGITRQQLYMIESNKTEDPGVLTIGRIAEVLGVTTDSLIKGRRKLRRTGDETGDVFPTEGDLVGATSTPGGL